MTRGERFTFRVRRAPRLNRRRDAPRETLERNLAITLTPNQTRQSKDSIDGTTPSRHDTTKERGKRNREDGVSQHTYNKVRSVQAARDSQKKALTEQGKGRQSPWICGQLEYQLPTYPQLKQSAYGASVAAGCRVGSGSTRSASRPSLRASSAFPASPMK